MSHLKNIIEAAGMIQKRDPAAHSIWEVLLTYPGFHALAYHQLANFLYRRRHYLLAVIIAHWGKRATGVDIHPGASIGKFLFIDHGNGVVIGETTIIGNQVTILHNVTLGSRKATDGRRHPKIEDGVFIGAGAQILGPVVIGQRAKVGAGTVVLNDVPDGATVVGNPGRIINKKANIKTVSLK